MDGMVTYIGLLLVSLILGVGAGLLRGKFSDIQKKYVSAAITCLIFVLILLMGLKTGPNESVISNLGLYGMQSLLIAAGAILGSIIFAMLFDKLFFRDGAR